MVDSVVDSDLEHFFDKQRHDDAELDAIMATTPLFDGVGSPSPNTAANGATTIAASNAAVPTQASNPPMRFSNLAPPNIQGSLGTSQPIFDATRPHSFTWEFLATPVDILGAVWLKLDDEGREQLILEFTPDKSDQCTELCLDSLSFTWSQRSPNVMAYSKALQFVRVQWQRTSNGRPVTGTTRSRVFTVASREDVSNAGFVRSIETNLTERVSNPLFAHEAADFTLEIPETLTSGSAGLSGGGGGGSGGKPNSSLGAGALPSATNAPEGAASLSGSSGLATGAIAGIAVAAAVVVIALVGFLVWFFVFRGRRKLRSDHVGDAPYHSDGGPAAAGGAHDFMMDKEAHGVVVADSPHSPYSDDGHGRDGSAAMLPSQAQSRGDASPRMMLQNGPPPSMGQDPYHPADQYGQDQYGHDQYQLQQERSYAPYQDSSAAAASSSPVATGASIHSSQHDASLARHSVRSSTPQAGAMPAAVAHLVEEGMTEDQIRRLEEEERALDEAIERAGRR